MTKQEVISQVQSSLGSLFTREDVVNCLNMVVEEPKVKPKMLNYPSKQWLDKIKNSILQRIKDVNFDDTDMYDMTEFEFDIRYGNTIEVTSFDVDACSLKVYVENEIEEAFADIEDEIIEIQEHNDKTEEIYQEELRLNSNESLKEAMED
jgi:hypothetical protein